MISLTEYNSKVMNYDFHRTNMFSVTFATTPDTKSANSLNGMNNSTYSTSPSLLKDAVGGFGGGIFGNADGSIDPNIQQDVNNLISNLITMGTTKYLQKHDGTRKLLFGAMSSRLGQSLLGEFEVGTYLLDFFANNKNNTTTYNPSLNVYAAKIPENKVSYEIDHNYHAPNIKITSRDLDPFVLSMRVNPDGSNYVAMNDWINAVDDPVSGKRGMPYDVECDIQVTLHDRQGVPHTIVMINGAIPVGATSPELSYESDGAISTFDVTFAYRYIQIGSVSEKDRGEYIEERNSQKSNLSYILNVVDSVYNAS